MSPIESRLQNGRQWKFPEASICLLLQITLIGWIPAALWAVYALSQWNTDRKLREAGHN
jgi:hypothetical protein